MNSLLQLVGAGPGDPDMLTLKAVRALKEADVILYDALVNNKILDHAPRTAIKEFVGKRFGCHSLSQAEINDLIIGYSSKYKKIVRLKGGDPFVFGRAQEEIEAAKAHGMEVEVIPGISSALAVPASEMIPVTARGTNESFWVTTGTTKSGEVSADIRLAAQSSATVIILMAMSKLEEIMEIFSLYGKTLTPVAIIQEGTTDKSKMVIGNVKDIAYRAQHAGLTNPAIIIIGEVVKLNNGHIADIVKCEVKVALRA